jgi:hypothetical protein
MVRPFVSPADRLGLGLGFAAAPGPEYKRFSFANRATFVIFANL